MRHCILLYRMAVRDQFRERNWSCQLHGFKPAQEPDWGPSRPQSAEEEDAEYERMKADYEARSIDPQSGRKLPGRL